MQIAILEHAAHETPANILPWAETNGHEVQRIKLYDGEKLPAPEANDAVIVMGGPMGVHDEEKFPWLQDEKAFLKKARDAGKKLVGFCLGSQLLADLLGAKILKAPYKEIGWFTLELTPEAKQAPLFEGIESPFLAFQWHGDTFELPAGALPVARGNVVKEQGFVVGDQILALQFHPEVNWDEVARWIKQGTAEMNEAAKNPYIQRPYQLLASPERFVQAEAMLHTLLDRFLGGGKKKLKPAPKKK
jgi:GMP synthase-like glutamine amidotransferase